MKILFIGNSFSQDANAHLYSLCEAGGRGDVELLNMYIGGCSFAMHRECIEKNLTKYMIEYNGRDYFDSIYARLELGLRYRDWDYVSIQQVSGLSGKYESFHPDCDVLIEKIKAECPEAKLLLHRTWAYDHGAEHFAFPSYDYSPTKMSGCIGEAYARLSTDIFAPIIPVGEVIEILRGMPEFDVRVGGASLHRDGFHLGLGYGRYAAAAVWYQAMGIGEILKNGYLPTVTGENDPKLYQIIKKVVAENVHPIVK